MKSVIAPIAPAFGAPLRRPSRSGRDKASLSSDACDATHVPVASGPYGTEFRRIGRIPTRPAASPNNLRTDFLRRISR